jgi:acyl dehydratase
MAKQGPFGQTIAHGYLSLSLLPMLMSQVMSVTGAKMGINYGTDKVRFTNPVPSGSEVRVKAKIVSSQPKGDGFLYKVAVELEIKDQDRPAMVGEVLYLVFA